MYKSIQIKNFRLFKDFKIDGLERINLISGDNNVGKTSLLEAIFMLQNPGNPRLPFYINYKRGQEGRFSLADQILNTLFNQLNMDEVIHIAGVDSDNQSNELELEVDSTNILEYSNLDNIKKSMQDDNRLSTLNLHFRHGGSYSSTARAEFTSKGINFHPMKTADKPKGYFIPAQSNIPQSDNAEQFGNLWLKKQTGIIIEALQIIDQTILGLTVIPTGDSSTIWCEFASGDRLPIYTMGSSIDRLLSILLAIANAPNGIVLVDEIESGFYFTSLTPIWKVIAKAARDADVQIFSVTHSQECIYYANKAFSEMKSKDFKFYRLSRKDDNIEAIPYDLELLNTSIEMNLEIR